MAESIIGLFKTEVIGRRGPWRTLDDVEIATLEWVDWFNHRCRLEAIGNVPPAEAEAGRSNQRLACLRLTGNTDQHGDPTVASSVSLAPPSSA